MCVWWCNYGHNSWVTYAKMSILIGTSFTIISIMPVTNHGVGLCWCPWGDEARGVQLSLWLPQWVLGSLENGCSRGQLIFAQGLALVQPQGRRSSVTPGALIRLVILVLHYVFHWGHEVTALLEWNPRTHHLCDHRAFKLVHHEWFFSFSFLMTWLRFGVECLSSWK